MVLPGKKRKGDLAISQQLTCYMTRNVSLAATGDKLVPDYVQTQTCLQPYSCDTEYQQPLQDTTVTYYSNDSGENSVSEV